MVGLKKVIELFSSLSRRESKEFIKFIESDYFNRKENLIQICSYLLKKINQNTNLNQDILLFKNALFQKYNIDNERNYHYIIQEINQLIQSYLVFNNIKSNSVEFNMVLLEEYEKRGLIHMLNSQSKKIEKLIDNNYSNLDKMYHMNFHKVSSTMNIPFSRDKRDDNSIPDNNLRYIYTATELENFVDFYTENAITSTHIDFYSILAFIEENRDFILINNILNTYSSLIEFVDRESTDFEFLVETVERNYTNNQEINYRLFTFAVTYIIVAKAFREKTLILLIKHYLILTNDSITLNNRVDIIFFVIIFKFLVDYETLDDYKKFLKYNAIGISKENRDSLNNLCEAMIYREGKPNPNALNLISVVSLQHPYFNIFLRILRLKIYYDLSPEEIYIHEDITNTEAYLRRSVKKYNENFRNRIINFLVLFKKIYRNQYGYVYEKEKKESLYLQLEYGDTVEKKWLLSKIDEL